MAADDGRRAREREEPASDRREDRLRVAAPEVGPADRAPEERVAGKRTAPAPSRRKQVEPGVWPGVWIARRAEVPKRKSSPSAIGSPGGSGGLAVSPNNAAWSGRASVEEAIARMQADRGARQRRELGRPPM